MEYGKSNTGRTYCYNLNMFYLITGTKLAFLDHYDYNLEIPAEQIGEDVMIATGDLEKIYGPYLKAAIAEQEVVVTYLEQKVRVKDFVQKEEKTLLPLLKVMKQLGKKVLMKDGFAVVCEKDEPEITIEMKHQKNWRLWKKSKGTLRRTIWHKNAEKLNTYRFFVPSCYQKGKPVKLLLVLHGASGDSDSMFATGPDLEYYAEKYGYAVLGLNSLVNQGNFGGLLSPQGMFQVDRSKAVPGDCDVYSPAWKAENKEIEQYIFDTIDAVKAEIDIDDTNIFVMGNSMGGIGTFHLPTVRPGYFKAMVPCGALPEIDYLQYDKLKTIPTMLVFGMEDHNWYERAENSVELLAERGMKIKLLPVGGYNHKMAWTRVIEDIFQFLNEQE